MSLSLLEDAVQAYIQELLDGASGPDHTAYVYSVTEDGFVILVARNPVQFDGRGLFTLTWRESLELFVRPGPMTDELLRRVEERKK